MDDRREEAEAPVSCPTCLSHGVVFQGQVVAVEFDLSSTNHPAPDSVGDHYWYPDATTTHYTCAHDHRWKRVVSKPCWCGATA